MTEDQIKAIAEEYAKTQIERDDCPSDEEYEWVLSRWVSDVSKVIQFIADRYCIVERYKVECYIRDVTRKVPGEEYSRGMYAGQKILLELLFGVQMFNQNKRKI